MNDRSTQSLYMELVAAKAAQLAHDLKNNKLWPGDLERGLQEIYENLNKVKPS